MIRQLIKITAVTTAALLAIGCAAKEFTEPENVAKTGSGVESFEFDFSKASASAAIVAAAATSQAPAGTTAVKFEVDSVTAQTGIRPAIFNIGTTYPYAQAQTNLLLNTNYNGTTAGLGAPKSVNMRLKWKTGSSVNSNQKVGVVIAFQQDLNKDGAIDTVAYGVQFAGANGAGSVLLVRVSDISGPDMTDGTCVTAGNVGNLSVASTEYTADISFVPANTTGTPVTITASVVGGTTATFVESLGTTMSTCMGGGADAMNTTQFTVGGTTATLGALVFGGRIPVWSIQVLAQNGDNSTPITHSDSPTITYLSVK